MKRLLPAMAALVLLASIACTGHAADDKKDSAKRLQQMLRKVEQEKAQLSQQKTAAENGLKEAQDKLEASQRKASGLGAKATALGRELEALKADQEKLSAKLAETEKQLADTMATLRSTEAAKRDLEATGERQRDTITTCEGKNVKLYRYGTELLQAYQGKGCASSLLQSEPLTGLKRVEIENLVEDYRDKLDEQKVAPSREGLASAPGK
ncbi:MAG: hypothetical protein EKK46_10440 [Rhodocyclaceae bacterium]|nr:MAG: hypothetical protein EKK46_10440 [Rhodocyclaceae bacterium]